MCVDKQKHFFSSIANNIISSKQVQKFTSCVPKSFDKNKYQNNKQKLDYSIKINKEREDLQFKGPVIFLSKKQTKSKSFLSKQEKMTKLNKIQLNLPISKQSNTQINYNK